MRYSTVFPAPDPRDSVIIESKNLKPGTGNPAATLRVYITNKDSLRGFVVALVEKTLTGNAYMTLGYPRSDTSGAAVRRLTQTLQGMTIVASNRYNSVSPDSFTVASFFDSNDPTSVEPPNSSRKAFLEIEFDTIKTDSGRVVFDSATIVFGQTSFVSIKNRDVPVNFVKGIITVDPIFPSVTVTAPNGDEAWGKSCPYTITWNATDNIGVTGIEIWLDRTNDGTFEQQIANLGSNPGSYNWIPGNPTSNNAKIKVIAKDGAGNTASDVSDGTFAILVSCPAFRLNAYLDINKDGIVGLVDVILVINSLYRDADLETVGLSNEYIENMLRAIFSASP